MEKTANVKLKKWFIEKKSEADEERLFVFHHAGGGATYYMPLLKELAGRYSVYFVQLPGREFRINEPAYESWDKLLDDLTEALLPYLDKPFTFFGHSADEKIESWAGKIRNGNYPKEGLHFYDHIAGLFGQRLWFCRETLKYSNKLKISDACVGCGLCVNECPMDNLVQQSDGKPMPQGKCTMCYRCISHCPTQAITLLGKEVVEQTTFDKFNAGSN